MTGSWCEMGSSIPDDDEDLLRELLSYDMICRHSLRFERVEGGGVQFTMPPSSLHWSRQFEWPWVLRHGDFDKNHRVLDAGSGWSVLKFAVARRSGSVDVVDIDEPGRAGLLETIERLGDKNIRYHHADMRALPFPDATFDRTVCTSVLEHVPDGRDRAMDELLRVTRPGGRLLLTLDVLHSGSADGNFFVDVKEAQSIYEKLGSPPYKEIKGTLCQVGDAIIFVLMFNYLKPLQAEVA